MKYKYKWCEGGMAAFHDQALDEAMNNYSPIVVSVGPHIIEIPMFPESFAELETMLRNTYRVLKDEYEGDLL